MHYTLPDGQRIDLKKVVEVGSIRDLGLDPNSISQSRIGFSIKMTGGESVQVIKNYHFCDWAIAKKELETIRKEIEGQIKDGK